MHFFVSLCSVSNPPPRLYSRREPLLAFALGMSKLELEDVAMSHNLCTIVLRRRSHQETYDPYFCGRRRVATNVQAERALARHPSEVSNRKDLW